MPKTSLPLCDLVMKGGITSGIVYPSAVFELKKAYRFHSIGGTSAGAIAAAGTAAAEYGRARSGNESSFDRLEAASKWLGQDGNLLSLFQATPETQPLFDVLIEALHADQEARRTGASAQPGKTGEPGQAVPPGDGIGAKTDPTTIPLFLRILHMFLPALSPVFLNVASKLSAKWAASYQPFQQGGTTGRRWGLVLSLVLAAALSFMLLGIVSLFVPTDGTWKWWLLLISFLLCGTGLGVVLGELGLWIGRIAGVVQDFLDILNKRLPNNFYGVCPGYTPGQGKTTTRASNLTDWLSAVVDALAGLPSSGKPLTCGDLDQQGIELKMVTSNLSHGRPYILPDELSNFIFKEADMLLLFPGYVVDQLKTPPSQPLVPLSMLPTGYHFLPDRKDLPVILCARLSLSYPLLLSAVPLYTIRATAYEEYKQQQLTGQFDPEKHFQPNWFSDGGICSNFPMHFFDAWLPQHPTFGINLTSLFTDTSALTAWDTRQSSQVRAARANGQDVYLPGAEDRQEPEWHAITQVSAFLNAIFNTAESYHDAMQVQLPSYRERAIQIRLDTFEGGLNLTMPPQTIEHLTAKGREAGQMLSNPDVFNFEHHWWVRFLVLMARLEENVETLQDFFDEEHSHVFMHSLEQEWSSNVAEETRYPYYRDKTWCMEASRRVFAMQKLIGYWRQASTNWGSPRFFRENAPLPATVLRVMPEL